MFVMYKVADLFFLVQKNPFQITLYYAVVLIRDDSAIRDVVYHTNSSIKHHNIVKNKLYYQLQMLDNAALRSYALR